MAMYEQMVDEGMFNASYEQGSLLMGIRQPSFSMLASPSIKVLSDDLEKESKKVRSMYEQGAGLDWEDGKYAATVKRANVEEPLDEEEPTT
jgi:hypothetical protein